MARTETPMFVHEFVGKGVNFSATGVQTIFDANANESQTVRSLCVQSQEAGAVDMTLYLHDGTTSHKMAVIEIPLNSGNAKAVPLFDVLAAAELAGMIEQDDSNNNALTIPLGWYLQADFASVANGFNVFIKGEVHGG